MKSCVDNTIALNSGRVDLKSHGKAADIRQVCAWVSCDFYRNGNRSAAQNGNGMEMNVMGMGGT